MLGISTPIIFCTPSKTASKRILGDPKANARSFSLLSTCSTLTLLFSLSSIHPGLSWYIVTDGPDVKFSIEVFTPCADKVLFIISIVLFISFLSNSFFGVVFNELVFILGHLKFFLVYLNNSLSILDISS